MNSMILLAFYLSGLSALIYEIIWSRMLTMVFGASVYGQSIILTLFMGGLAIGSKLFGNHAKSVNSPIKLYARLEGYVALFAIPTFFMTDIIYFFEIQNNSIDIPFKIFIASIFILPSTIAMGGTFPTLFKALSDHKQNHNSDMVNISNLYFINTLGALCGIVLCSYFLLPYLGMTNSLIMSIFVNVLIFAYFYLQPAVITPPESDISKTSKDEISYKALIALFLSGFNTMLYELSWSRALNFSFGSSTFTFSLIIFSFIFGLSLGALYVKKKSELPHDRKTGLICDFQLKAIIASSIFLFLSSKLPLITDLIFQYSKASFIKLHLIEVSILIIIIAPVAFYIGASFPLLCVMASKKSTPNENTIGIAYSINTTGSIFGALITGFLLIVLLGPFKVIVISIIIHLSIIYLIYKPLNKYDIRNFSFVLLIVIVFVSFHFLFSQKQDLLSGYYSQIFLHKQPYVPKYLSDNPKFIVSAQKKSQLKTFKTDLEWFEDGLTCSVAVVSNNIRKSLLINGKPDASVGNFYYSDMPTQTFLGFIPVLFAPKLENALIVGYGSGTTTGILAQHFKTVKCLEIENKVIEASKLFREYNFDASNLPNVNIVIGDARKIIRKEKNKYDIISAEPSNIWVSGVSYLFTREYFNDCYNLLNDNGLMIQWLHLYKLS
ncbi:MAG: spermine/spermidine synthase family protein, partial [uncultured bacterium]